MTTHELLAGFPVIIEISVAWGDMDALGHVNNTMFFRYFESVRIAYLDAISFLDQQKPAGPILASTQCRFRKPLTYPDSVLAAARVSDLGEDRFTHEYRLVSTSNDHIVADGSGVVVAYDYESRVKCALPADVREHIERMEGDTPVARNSGSAKR